MYLLKQKTIKINKRKSAAVKAPSWQQGGSRDLVPLIIEFVNIGAIDCLVGLMAVHVNKTAEWWVVDRMHGNGGTYDTVIGDVVGGSILIHVSLVMCNSVEIPHQPWEFHNSIRNLTSVMWVWKKPQRECGRFSMSSYNPTQCVWNPLFPHLCRGNSTDLRFVG